jgi:uncharacterized damage-inducible protein DinB
MNPAEAKVVADFLLADMAYEMQTTMGVLGAVPVGRMDYKPDEKSRTALGLVRHITLEDEWILAGVADGKFVPPPDDSDACGVMTPQDAVARYKEKIPAAMDRVRALSGEQLLRSLDLLGVIQMPAINFLSLALKHSVHHRGQLSSYFRAMGGKVPSIYGPTADMPKP